MENIPGPVAPTPTPKKKPKVQIFLAVLAAVGFVGFKVLVKGGLIAGLAMGRTELAVQQSKNDPWPAEFKTEFAKKCVEGVAGDPSVKDPLIKAGMTPQSYCQCSVDVIESKHLISFKYNSITTSEDDWVKKEFEPKMSGAMADKDVLTEIAQCAVKGSQQRSVAGTK